MPFSEQLQQILDPPHAVPRRALATPSDPRAIAAPSMRAAAFSAASLTFFVVASTPLALAPGDTLIAIILLPLIAIYFFPVLAHVTIRGIAIFRLVTAPTSRRLLPLSIVADVVVLIWHLGLGLASTNSLWLVGNELFGQITPLPTLDTVLEAIWPSGWESALIVSTIILAALVVLWVCITRAAYPQPIEANETVGGCDRAAVASILLASVGGALLVLVIVLPAGWHTEGQAVAPVGPERSEIEAIVPPYPGAEFRRLEKIEVIGNSVEWACLYYQTRSPRSDVVVHYQQALLSAGHWTFVPQFNPATWLYTIHPPTEWSLPRANGVLRLEQSPGFSTPDPPLEFRVCARTRVYRVWAPL